MRLCEYCGESCNDDELELVDNGNEGLLVCSECAQELADVKDEEDES